MAVAMDSQEARRRMEEGLSLIHISFPEERMNKKMIGKLVGVLFFLEALFMLPAIAVCFVYGETGAPLRGFLWTVALLLALSGALYGVCAKRSFSGCPLCPRTQRKVILRKKESIKTYYG